MISAILVAAGKGLRMKSGVRKQYMLLAGQPIIAHTIKVFDACSLIDTICLVLPETDIPFFEQRILPDISLKTTLILSPGGDHRQASVYKGLLKINDPGGIVLIHDGVRPFVTPELITACIEETGKTGACIPAVRTSDTLKRVDQFEKIINTVKRDDIVMAQTPQAFSFDLIRHAHERCLKDGVSVTDDASIAEYTGVSVKVIQGLKENIKITTPEDLKLAQALLMMKNKGFTALPKDFPK